MTKPREKVWLPHVHFWLGHNEAEGEEGVEGKGREALQGL